MKEITRIHIAKIAYDIEPAAKKAIESYIQALEQYTDDQELLTDIEIRITELLTEHGVKAGGVITAQDVAAVRAQLGEPVEFLPEDTGEFLAGNETTDGRRLYRDLDAALFGGVLAGIANYFGISAVWTRLIFLVSLFASFGVTVIVYLLLWLVVPPAKTAAEKLRMRGQPATLASIKALGQQESSVNESAQVVRRVLISAVGVGLVLAAVASLAATATVAGGLVYSSGDAAVGQRMLDTWWMVPAILLCSVAGVLLAALCAVLSAAVFSRRWSKRTTVAVVVIVASGLLAFAGGIGTAWYGSWTDNAQLSQLRKTSRSSLPAEFAQVKNLTINGTELSNTFVNIDYVVDATPRYEVESLPGVTPHVELSNDKQSAVVTVKTDKTLIKKWSPLQISVKIYGPALDTIRTEAATVQYHNANEQSSLAITGNNGSFNLAGAYKSVQAVVEGAGTFSLDGATIETLNATTKGGTVSAGVVRNLSVTQHDVCPLDTESESNTVQVRAVASGIFTYNDTQKPATSLRQECGQVVIGDMFARYENQD